MPQSFTAVTPVTNADVDENLTPQLPLGSETRIVAGFYSATQKMLNMASAVAVWWKGGTLGDPTNVNDATKRVTVENMVTFNSNIDVEGVSFACTNCYVSAQVQCHDTQCFNDTTSDRDIHAGRDISAGRNLSVVGSAAITGALSCGSLSLPGPISCTALTSSSVSVFNGGVAINHVSVLSAALEANGAGRVYRPGIVGTSATTTVDPTVATDYCYPTTLSADTTATIVDSGIDGDELFVSNFSPSHTVTVNLPGGGGAIGAALKNASGSYLSYRMKRLAGNWFVIDYSKVP